MSGAASQPRCGSPDSQNRPQGSKGENLDPDRNGADRVTDAAPAHHSGADHEQQGQANQNGRCETSQDFDGNLVVGTYQYSQAMVSETSREAVTDPQPSG